MPGATNARLCIFRCMPADNEQNPKCHLSRTIAMERGEKLLLARFDDYLRLFGVLNFWAYTPVFDKSTFTTQFMLIYDPTICARFLKIDQNICPIFFFPSSANFSKTIYNVYLEYHTPTIQSQRRL